jgi:hypothetical protein
MAVTKVVRTWQAEGQIDNVLSQDPALVSATCGGALSFRATTVVATSHGARAIGSLHSGEKVWAYNTHTHKMELQPIIHVWINHDNDLVDLTITFLVSIHHKKPQKISEVIHTTKKHPFLTPDKGFVAVSKLHVGMYVVRADGQLGVISKWRIVPGAMTMYNLEVAQDHTFTVGDGQWIVHNCEDTGEIDLKGADYNEIMKYLSEKLGIPQEVLDNPEQLNPLPNNPTLGLRWKYSDTGLTFNMRIHSPDPNAPAGSNSVTEWVLRILKSGDGSGKWQLTRYGQWVKARGPSRLEGDINDAHIPIQDQTTDPTSPLYNPADPADPVDLP